MNEYDIVVVGGGPAGLPAARTAAEKGAEVLLIEEHGHIGLPEHCFGLFSGDLSGQTKEELDAIFAEMDPRVVLYEVKRQHMWSPSGRLYEWSSEGTGARIASRPMFEMELAKLAVKAGAKIAVRTKVTDLIREDGFIRGVITDSKTMPEVRCKVVIAADGIRSQFAGIPKWEGLAAKEIGTMSGILWHLGGVKDVEPGVIEGQLGTFARRGWANLCPHDKYSAAFDFTSISEFETVKAGNWAFSRKIRDCQVLGMEGYSHPYPAGRPLPKKVKNGLILVGDAAGLGGNTKALMSGKLGGEAAAKAIEAGDISEKGLGLYEELINKRRLGERSAWHDARFFDKTEEELEELWDKVKRGEILAIH